MVENYNTQFASAALSSPFSKLVPFRHMLGSQLSHSLPLARLCYVMSVLDEELLERQLTPSRC